MSNGVNGADQAAMGAQYFSYFMEQQAAQGQSLAYQSALNQSTLLGQAAQGNLNAIHAFCSAGIAAAEKWCKEISDDSKGGRGG